MTSTSMYTPGRTVQAGTLGRVAGCTMGRVVQGRVHWAEYTRWSRSVPGYPGWSRSVLGYPGWS